MLTMLESEWSIVYDVSIAEFSLSIFPFSLSPGAKFNLSKKLYARIFLRRWFVPLAILFVDVNDLLILFLPPNPWQFILLTCPRSALCPIHQGQHQAVSSCMNYCTIPHYKQREKIERGRGKRKGEQQQASMQLQCIHSAAQSNQDPSKSKSQKEKEKERNFHEEGKSDWLSGTRVSFAHWSIQVNCQMDQLVQDANIPPNAWTRSNLTKKNSSLHREREKEKTQKDLSIWAIGSHCHLFSLLYVTKYLPDINIHIT